MLEVVSREEQSVEPMMLPELSDGFHILLPAETFNYFGSVYRKDGEWIAVTYGCSISPTSEADILKKLHESDIYTCYVESILEGINWISDYWVFDHVDCSTEVKLYPTILEAITSNVGNISPVVCLIVG